MECSLVWNHMRFQNQESAHRKFNSKYDFRPKLHGTKFNYWVPLYYIYFEITNSVAQWGFFFLSGQVFHWSIILSLFEKSCKSCISFSRNLMNQWISLPAVYCCLWDFFHHLFNLKADSCVWVSPYSPFLGTAAYCTISSGLWKKLLTSLVNSTKVWADGTCVDE